MPTLDPANRLAWRIWCIASRLDRPITFSGIGPIPSGAILALCQAMDATDEDFERIIVLEEKIFPLLVKQKPEGMGNAGNKG